MERIPPLVRKKRFALLGVPMILVLIASLLVVAPVSAEDVPSGSIFPSVYDPSDGKWKNGNPKGYSEGEVAIFEGRLTEGASTPGDPWEMTVCLDYFQGDTYMFTDFAEWDSSYSPETLSDGTVITDMQSTSLGFITFLYPAGDTLTIESVSDVYVNATSSGLEQICVDVEYAYDGVDDVYLLTGGYIGAPGDTATYTQRQDGSTAVLPTGGTVVNGASNVGGTFQVRLGSASGDKTINFQGGDVAPADPTLTLIKVVDNTGGGTALNTDWNLTATLDGAVDPALSGTTGVNDSVAPGTYTLAEEAAGTVTGSYIESWDCGETAISETNQIELAAADEVTCTVTNTFAALAIDKVVTTTVPEGGFDVGDVIEYQITVTNPSNAELTGVDVSDPLLADLDCDPATEGNQTSGFTLAPTDGLPGGADELVCTGSYTVQQSDVDDNGGGDGDIDNTATAGSDQTDDVTDDAEAPLERNASIDIIKSGPATIIEGGTAEFEITVTNDGNVNLTDVIVSDALADECALTWADVQALNNNDDPAEPVGAMLKPGESFTYTCTATADEVADNTVDGVYTNTAEVDGTPTGGGLVEDSDPAAVTVLVPELSLAKSAVVTDSEGGDKDPAHTVTEAGDLVVYTITATNTGETELTGVDVTDPKVTLECAWPSVEGVLAIGQSVECTGTYTVQQSDIDSNGDDSTDGADGDIDNVASATSDQAEADDAPASVPISQNASIDIVKSGPATIIEGGTAEFEITVTNDGNVSLTNVVVSDALAADCALSWADVQAMTNNDIPVGALVGDALEPGESFTYTCTATADEVADNTIDGVYTNTADVVGSPETGDPVDDSDDAAVTVLVPELSLAKSAVVTDSEGGDKDPANTVTEAGDLVVYTITATNTGETELTNVEVTDPKVTLTCTWPDPENPGVLAIDESVECTGTYTVQQSDIDSNGDDSADGADGDIDNTASATSDQDDAPDAPASVPLVQDASIDIAKYHDLDEAGDEVDTQTIVSGSTATWTITVTNDGNVSLTGVSVSDPNAPFCAIGAADVAALTNSDGELVGDTLEPGESFTYDCSLADVTADMTNTASVDSNEGATDEDTSDVDVINPGLTVTKTVDSPIAVTGDTTEVEVVFTINVKNTGDVAIDDVTVSDPGTTVDCGDGTAVIGTMEPGDEVDCTATVTVTPDADGNWTALDNTAEACGTNPLGGEECDDSDVTADFAGIVVEKKVVEVDEFGDPIGDPVDELTVVSGSDIQWVIEVTNIGSVIIDFDLADAEAPGCNTADGALAPGMSVTITCDVLGIDADVVNTAVVTTNIDGVGDDDDAAVNVINPGLSIVKSIDAPVQITADTTEVDVVFTIMVENTGDVALTGVTLTDSIVGAAIDCDAELAGLQDMPDTLEPGDTVTCTATVTHTPDADGNWAPLENTATVCGTDPVGSETCDEDDATADLIGIAVEKQVSLSPTGPWSGNVDAMVGDTVYWQVIVTNIGTVDLTDVEVVDEHNPDCSAVIGDLAAGESAAAIVCSETATYSDSGVFNVAVATGCAEADETGACVEDVSDDDTAAYSADYNGFTPGFWKNHAKGKNNMFDGDLLCGDVEMYTDTTFGEVYGDAIDGVQVWVKTGKGRNATLSQVDLADLSIYDALSLQGGDTLAGAAEILLRAAAASTLNTCYHMTLGNEIGDVDDVWPITLDDLGDELAAALNSDDRDAILDLAAKYDGWNNGAHEIDWSIWRD